MRRVFILATLFLALVLAGAVSTAYAQTCIRIDEPRDTLSQDERIAARLLISRQFELAGQTVVEKGIEDTCERTYTLSHVRLGTTIIVTLSGPTGTREGKALGLDDLPAVYSQMVRSLVTGEPMGSLAVVDRTNVSAVQDQLPRRVQSDGYWHARVGHSSLVGTSTSTQSAAGFGFGYRAVFHRFGLDLSFLNMQLANGGSYYSSDTSASSLIKLEGLYFLNPDANRSAYVGTGVSYGRTNIRTAPINGDLQSIPRYGRGAGLQGELTAGYEIARVTSARLFVQADVTLPFYNVEFETYSYPEQPSTGRYVPPIITVSREYVPSLTFSVGIGWQRGGRR